VSIRKLFAAGPIVAVLAFAGCPLLFMLMLDNRAEWQREGIRRLRGQYPFESLERRLPVRSQSRESGPLSPPASQQLQEFENSISNEMQRWGREQKLQKLHDGSVEEFVKREGFGVNRMFGGYAESVFANGSRNKTSIPQPNGRFSLSFLKFDLSVKAPSVDPSKLLSFHSRNLLHFANPGGFGFMKDRLNVAGFQAHQFNELLEEKPWKIIRLELLGLILEDRPRVYVTAALPRMQEISGVPTRSPDAFESAGLAKLLGGDELFINATTDGVSMLGAIRIAQQCIKCHGGVRGNLLGAFSYGLMSQP